jgi:hypothetical protein
MSANWPLFAKIWLFFVSNKFSVAVPEGKLSICAILV